MTSINKVRGWVRGSPRHPARKQHAALIDHCGAVYDAAKDDVHDYIKWLREGDVVLVTTLARLASHRDEVQSLVKLIHLKKCVILEAGSGRRSDRVEDLADMAFDAARELAGDKPVHSRAEAIRKGNLGGHPKAERSPVQEAAVFWKNTNLAPAEALKRMPGWTMRAAYRDLGTRGMAAGRPRKDDSLDPPKLKIYFVQNGDAVKIGVSKNPEQRMSELSVSSNGAIQLLAVLDGGHGDEKEFHRKFSRYLIRGEWFKYQGELAKFIATLPPYEKPDPKRRKLRKPKRT